MPDSFFSTLPAEVQHQLNLCGITSDEQLAAGYAATIYQELQTAARLFPGECIRLTEAEISELIRKAAEYVGIPVQDKPSAKPVTTDSAPEFIYKTARISVPREDEPLRPSGAENNSFQNLLKSANRHVSEGKAVSSGHPFALWFGALACALVPLFFICLCLSPFVLLRTDFPLQQEFDASYALLLIVLILPHLIMVRLVHCSVCHINLFTFRSYPHHRDAHRLPLLGVPASTALRILFTFRFTCPACGTKQKLFGRHKHRHSRKH